MTQAATAGESTALAPVDTDTRILPKSTSFGIIPRTLEEAWRYAKMLSDSDLVPKDYRNKPENCMVAMQYGAEIGLPPMASLQSVAVINGRPGVFGDGFLAVIMATAAYAGHKETYLVDGVERDVVTEADYAKEDTTAVCTFWRRGVPHPFVSTFSIAQAKKAGLWKKEGPWTQYPARMLRMRARAFAGRDAFAAELRGVAVAEELHDLPAERVTSSTVAVPVRISERAGAPEPGPAQPPAPAPAPAPSPTRDAVDRMRERNAVTVGGPPQVCPSMVITDTQLVQPKGVDPFFEVKATLAVEGNAPVGYVFVTGNEALFKVAQQVEGSGTLMKLFWQPGKRYDGSPAKLLIGIEAVD